MKKLLLGLFIFGFLFVGAQASAYTLKDAQLQIQSLIKEITLLKAKLGASALSTTEPLTCRVVSFSVLPTTIIAGQPVTISWNTENCISTSISASDLFSGYGIVTAMGTKTAYPKANISYYLSVSESTQTGSVITETNPILITVNGTPTFVNISTSAGSNGTISPAGPISIPANLGQTQQFTITPSTGYTPSVTGCGGSLSGSIYTTSVITSSCTVSATFTRATVTNLPTLSNPTATNITSTTATIGATVTSLGSPTASAGGMCYDQMSGTTGCNTGGIALGTISRNLTGLTPNTRYYYTGQAYSSLGTAYTTIPFSFMTLPVSTTPTLRVSLDSTSPISQNIVAGSGNVTFARIQIKADSQDVKNLNAIQISSDIANSTKLNNITIYDGATKIGSTSYGLTYNGSYYQTWVYLNNKLSIPANTSKVLSIIADTSPVGSSSYFSGNVRLGVTGWTFDYPGASVIPFGSAIYGSTLTVINNTTTPSITVISPNGGESYIAGQQISVTWNSKNLPVDAKIRVVLSSPSDLISTYNPTNYYVSNSGSMIFTLPKESDFVRGGPIPWGKNFQFVISTPNLSSTAALALDLSDNTFTINPISTGTLLSKISPCSVYGDVNYDISIDSKDINIISQNIGGVQKFTANQTYRADVNVDGVVNVMDINVIKNYLAGTISTFPSCTASVGSQATEPGLVTPTTNLAIPTPVTVAPTVPVKTCDFTILNDYLKANPNNGSMIKMQTVLKNEGYYTGKIDGSFGPQSRAALRAFQASKGF